MLTCALSDNEDEEGLAKLAVAARDVLLGILEDPALDFTMRKEEFEQVPTSPVKPVGPTRKSMYEPLPQYRWNHAVKLFLVRDLFTLTRAVIPSELFAELAESVLRYLNVREDKLVGEEHCTDQVREQWASLCAEVTFACDTSVLQAFWENTLRKGRRETEWEPEVRSVVWQVFVERWDSKDAGDPPSWETAVVLLSAPFIGASDWDMESEAIDMWDQLLKQAIDTALDHGIDAITLLDQIAGVIASNHSPSSTAAVRIADLLLPNIEIAEARQVPTEVFEFANDTLAAAYPPAPRHKVMCMWLIRTLTRVIDACPAELCFSMLQLVVEGLQIWTTDEFGVCTAEDYSCDVSLESITHHTLVLTRCCRSFPCIKRSCSACNHYPLTQRSSKLSRRSSSHRSAEGLTSTRAPSTHSTNFGKPPMLESLCPRVDTLSRSNSAWRPLRRLGWKNRRTRLSSKT